MECITGRWCLNDAVSFAREYAEEGLRACPFDAVYSTTLLQLDLVTSAMDAEGVLRSLPDGNVTLGIMAVKELGDDERDFTRALHVVQRYADAAMT